MYLAAFLFSKGAIVIGTSWGVNEVMGRAQKLQVERSLMTDDGLGCGIEFETLLKDSLHAINVEQFETQRALAGGIEAGGAALYSGLSLSIAPRPGSFPRPTTAASPVRCPSFVPPGMPFRVLHSRHGLAQLLVNPGGG